MFVIGVTTKVLIGGIHGYWFGIKVFSCSPMQFVG